MTDDLISRETFDHLVDLAAFELKPEEAEYLRQQMNNQLKVIHELAAIPLDENLPLTTYGVPFTPEISAALRPDEWHPFDNAAGILAQTPQRDENYIVVPDIPHTTLE